MEPLAAFQVLMLTVAGATAVEAFKERGVKRILFLVILVIAALLGILTNKIAAAWPAAAAFMIHVGSSPVVLFFVFLAWLTYVQRPWRRTPSEPQEPAPGAIPTPEQRFEQRKLIVGACRGAVIGFRDETGYFSDYIEGGASFMQIRRHLSPSFLDEFERSRHSVADEGSAGVLPALARQFLREVDTVAEKWGIE